MKQEERLNWEEPRILELGALPDALGHCQAGTTGQQGGNVCANGTTTGQGVAHDCSVGIWPGGRCINGTNYTSTCIAGNNPK